MGQKHHKPEEIIAKLRQVEVLTGQACLLIGISAFRSVAVALESDMSCHLKTAAEGVRQLNLP